MSTLHDVAAAWIGLLLGVSGIGAVFAVIVRFLAGARGGLR